MGYLRTAWHTQHGGHGLQVQLGVGMPQQNMCQARAPSRRAAGKIWAIFFGRSVFEYTYQILFVCDLALLVSSSADVFIRLLDLG